MRSILLATAATVVALTCGSAAQANGIPELDVHTLVSADGGCCGASETKQVPTTNLNLVVSSNLTQTFNGSFADARATATFGALHAYSDAFMAAGIPDAQSDAEATYIEYFDPKAVSQSYNLIFNITGTSSPQPQFGPGPSVIVTWRLDDLTARDTIVLGSWFLGKPMSFVVPVYVPAGDATRYYVDISLFTYDGAQSVPGLVYADYSNTVHTYIDPVGGGPDVIGVSGHDYASPAVGGVPEPASWALMILGFGAVGAATRRRRSVSAAA